MSTMRIKLRCVDRCFSALILDWDRLFLSPRSNAFLCTNVCVCAAAAIAHTRGTNPRKAFPSMAKLKGRSGAKRHQDHSYAAARPKQLVQA